MTEQPELTPLLLTVEEAEQAMADGTPMVTLDDALAEAEGSEEGKS